MHIARTEETGEVDVELYVPMSTLELVWEQLWSVGKPLGLKPSWTKGFEFVKN